MCAPESKAEAGEVVRYLGWSRRSDWKLGNFCIILQSSMRSGFICRFGPSTKRLVCGLALLALFVPSLSHAQVIEEGGFPVKAGSVWGEPFSLSCPPRLYAQAGESVLFSCSATSVPEEGVRYEWEPLSGDGLRLLSDANERSPLFTAPVSGEGAEYAYRLTAMSVGVYETATVTVVVGGVSGGSVQDRGKSPGLPEGCDSFGAFEGFREGCVGEDKAPVSFEPFGGGFEEEEGPGLLFPEAPGLPDRSSGPVRGGGPSRQAPPYLECPVAVFLEELETGRVECHAWDAAGEEYLEYAWEPAGSTTRDYLDNLRLIPEDSPTPSVIAPEAPAYETLESFRSGDRAFRYRYRLTVTSRATGLSSSSEVEVYVSSSRPSVYCPLEIVVEEGETIALDCEGVDPLSSRMDYDEESASVLWEWEGLWGTSTAPLDATHLSSPLFKAPLGSAGKQYHYIASMTSQASGMPRMARRRVSVVVMDGEEAVDDTVVGVASTAPDSRTEAVVDSEVRCSGTGGVETDAIWAQGFLLEIDFYVDEGDPDFTIQCEISGVVLSVGPIIWSWTGSADAIDLLEATDTSNPVFHVPDDVDQDTKYEYIVTAERGTSGSEIVIDFDPVSVTVSDEGLPLPSLTCTDSKVYEATADFTLDCSGANEPTGATYAWAVRGSTSDTDLLGSTTILKPTFYVPDNIDADKDYEYTVTLSASGITDVTEDVTITVLEKPDIGGCPAASSITIWEGTVKTMITCQQWSGAPGVNPVYTYRWTPRGGTTDTQRLSDPDEKLAEFHAPEELDDGETEIYEYRLTVSAANADNGIEDYTVIVNDQPNITITCADSRYEVHEGDADIELECEASGRWDSTTFTPQGTWYTWQWLPRTNLTGDTDIIPGDKENDTSTPTFAVPDNVDRDTTYTYTVTATSANSEDGTAEVTVTVRDTDSADPSLTCTDSEVYEATADFTLDCSVTNEPTGATYAWSVRGSTANTDDLSSTTILKPTFSVPTDINESDDADKDYKYTVTLSAGGADVTSADITVTVLEKPDIVCLAASETPNRFLVKWGFYESLPDFPLNACPGGWTGAPAGSDYTYAWKARGGTPDTRLLSATNIEVPTFDMPDAVDKDETYYYTLTVSAENADDALARVEVTVWDRPDITVTCEDSPYEVYEGAADFALDCSVTNEPTGATYAWSVRGSTSDTDDLSSTTILKPTFSVPDDIDEPSGADKDYEYTVTMMSGGSEVASADVTVTVKEKPDIVCVAAHITVSEFRVPEGYGHLEIASCSEGWTGAPSGSVYAYVWTARGDTPDTALLVSGTNGPSPTFSVPSSVNGAETYEYRLTVSAENADPAVVDYKITVHDGIAVICVSPDPIYEGSGALTLSCTEENKPTGATYVWTGTDVDNRLTDTGGLTPTFTPPPNVDADTDYDYTVTMMSGGSEVASADVTVTVLNTLPSIACTATPDRVYEGSADDITVSCSAQNTPSVPFIYAWDGSDDFVNLLKGWNGDWPIFRAPDNVNGDTEYVFTVNIYIGQNGCQPDLPGCALDSVAETDVTVTVLEKPDIAVTCPGNPYAVDEGDSLALDCAASGAPDVNSKYMWSWSPTDRLTNHDSGTPTFDVPDDVPRDTTWTYRVTAMADNADDGAADVTVTVRDRYSTAPVITCNDSEVYEATADITLDCSVTDEPTGATYAWTGTDIANRLSSSTILKPTFDVPDNVDAHTDYDYTVTLSASGINDVTEDVTVRVLNKPSLALICTPVAAVYEDAASFDLDCAASGAPSGSEYNYVWTPRGSTVVPGQLSSTTVAKPTFDVPDNVDADTDYEYTLTVSADNAEDATADVTVTVLNKKALNVACATPSPVYEGSADLALDCVATGAPAGSAYTYVWTARGATTNTDLLVSGTGGPTPTFAVPDEVDDNETHEYLLTVSAANAEDASAEVTVTVLNLGSIALICASPPLVYEGSENFALVCSVSGDTGGAYYTYEWTARGATPNTDELSATNIPSPTFYVPDEVDETTTYEYALTARAANVEDATAAVTVTVLNRGTLAVACAPPPLVYEGSEDFALDCTASGAPVGSVYEYVWTARSSTANTDLLISGTDGPTPTFAVPDEVAATTTYEYLLTVSAENAESSSAAVTVTVLNAGALHVVCASPGSVYEGSEDLALDCTASGAPAGSDYAYAWTARGDTPDTALLIAGTDGPTPTFAVPDEVASATTYEYLLTVSAENAESGSAAVTVTVLNAGALHVVCASPGSVYEGSEDLALDCTASGAPAGSDYEYVWTARGSTANTDLLSRADISSPTFYVPDEVDETTTYEYLLTVSAENAEDATAEVTVTVLNRGPLNVVCADPASIYEGAEDFALDCSASGAPAGSDYAYVWTAQGDTKNTLQLSAVDISSPTFYVPDEVDETTTYEYLLTVSAENAENATAEVTVTVLNKPDILLACADPGLVYEGSADFALDCSASGAPGDNPQYTYAWTARGDTQDTSLLSAADIASPTFAVPEEVDGAASYEYLLTASAQNAENASAQVTVTVLDKPVLAVACAGPYSLYEGSEDFAFDCSASGAPGADPQYTYAWTARGDTPDASLLSRADVASPTFLVPDDLPETTTYEYLLTASARNAEDASAGVSVTVMHPAPLAFTDDSIAGRVYIFTVGETIEDIVLPDAKGGFRPYAYTLSPALPAGLAFDDRARTISGTPSEVRPRREYAWQVSDTNGDTAQIAFFIEVAPVEEPASPPVAESSPEVAEPSLPQVSALGVTVSASSLDFGVQSAETQVSLDPMTDGISTHVSGPYHAGRMTLSPGGSEAIRENGEMALSIELASPVVLRREGGIEDASIVLAPQWSLAESCEQLSSQTIGGLYTEVTLSDADCRLLHFGGELDLTDAASGRYTGSMDLILRSGESEETHSVEVDVTVIPAQQIITIGPRGVRFSTSRELSAGLTEEQNLSIYPDVAFLTEGKPHGVFELSNPSLIPLEISVSARFGYTEATENGREVVVEDASGSRLSDLSEVVDIHPGVVVLQPGEKGLVRYGVKEGALAAMAEKGYAAFFDVVSEPRQYVRTDQMPEEVSGEKTARVTMRIPGVYVPGEGASQLRATLLSTSYVGSMSATFLVETQDHPFVGEVVAYDGDGRELGRRETLVYTRSRVRVPLDRIPEEGAVFLRFSPRGSGRVPEPASVEWYAPRRDIGASGDEGRTSLPATLVQKP